MSVSECMVEAGDWPGQPRLFAVAGRAVEEACAATGSTPPDGAVGIVFTDDAHIRDLNARWRGKDRPTNVLSFPAGPQPGAAEGVPLGDIVLARETIAREAAADGKAFDDHLAHLVVHGFLHLIGYDHESEEEAEAMEAMERRILHALAIDDPYA